MTFFMMGWLDFFHIMTYNGMEGLFVEASTPRATTYWIISRTIQSVGILLATMISYRHKSMHNQSNYLIATSMITFLVFYLVSFQIQIFPPLFIEGKGLTPLKIYLEYGIIITFLLSAILMWRDFRRTQNKYFMIFIVGLVYAIFTEVAFTLYRSVYDTYNVIGHIYKIISGYYLFKGIFLYNLENHFRQLADAKETIKLHAENLEKIIAERTMEVRRNNEKMIVDLEYAKLVQQSLLPPESVIINDVKFVSCNYPCEKLSGDFYYIHKIDEENIGLVIADVSGHGVSAAMMTVFTERVIRHNYYRKRDGGYITSGETLQHLYNQFNQAQFPDEMHIVLFNAIYNTTTMEISYCSGGMNTIPILFRKSGEIEYLKNSEGFPICKMGEFFQPNYKDAKVLLNKGDRIIFFTDGLTESIKSENLISKQRLIEIMKSNNQEDLSVLKSKIDQEISDVTITNENDDDITYFIMEA